MVRYRGGICYAAYRPRLVMNAAKCVKENLLSC